MTTLSDRFWSKVCKGSPADCWEWQASVRGFGYGQFNVAGSSLPAHRVAYELTHGSIPKGLVVRHQCDNPRCCNPAHLEPGTKLDNAQDAVKRGRLRPPRGVAHHRAKLTQAQVDAIRTSAESNRALSEIYGMSDGQISRIRTGKSWSPAT
jgi:hypothetical protein